MLKKCYIVAITFHDTSLRYGGNIHILFQMQIQISKTKLNMYFKQKSVSINSTHCVYPIQTFYNLLVFKVYFNCCKVEGHYLPQQIKNDPPNKHGFISDLLLFYENTQVLFFFIPFKRPVSQSFLLQYRHVLIYFLEL